MRVDQGSSSGESQPATADYGIDSPPMLLSFVAAAFVAAIAGIFIGSGAGSASAGIGPWIASLLFAGAAAYLVWSSKRGKAKLWDQVLDDLALTGQEKALDVGCGRGLVLIKLAHRLPKGKVSGVDVWRAKDQSGNAEVVCRANAEVEGVTDRVDIRTADMRELPFGDRSFDLVTASMSIHHLPLAADRGQAVKEIIRVVKPGGKVVIVDVGKTFEYGAWLEDATFKDLKKSGLKFLTYPPSRVVSGRKPNS